METEAEKAQALIRQVNTPWECVGYSYKPVQHLMQAPTCVVWFVSRLLVC